MPAKGYKYTEEEKKQHSISMKKWKNTAAGTTNGLCFVSFCALCSKKIYSNRLSALQDAGFHRKVVLHKTKNTNAEMITFI